MEQELAYKHVSVLKEESIQGLEIRPGGIYVDCTLGGAGHAEAICRALNGNGRLIGIDQDEEAIETSKKRLAPYEHVTLIRENFSHITDILQSLGIEKADGFLMDLGVSSRQLDEPSRGFSYMHDAPLDMRMDNRQTFSAYDVVNTYSASELERVLWEYGEERWSRRIAALIVEEREKEPIRTTSELVRVIKKAIPKSAREGGSHPAKRSFQAIRIEVNGELSILGQTISDMTDALRPGGRIVVITFHSLEDRIVKQTFRTLENPCICPKEFPVCVCGRKPKLKVITRKPVLPGAEELENNPRSRSAKLRIAERTGM